VKPENASRTVDAHLHTLHLREPFRIAHGVSSTRTVLRLSRDGAIGEAPFVPYYEDPPEEVLHWIETLHDPEECGAENAPRTVRLAFELLQLDAEGKRAGKSLGELFKVPFVQPQPVARSVSIPENLEDFSQKILRLTTQFSILKLKLGSGCIAFDKRVVEHAKEAAPEKVLFADANGGWSIEQAVEILPHLKNLGVAFVEQPIARIGGARAWKTLHETLREDAPPLYADESVQNPFQLEEIGEWIAGVNVKLLKCGSFAGALEFIRLARMRGLRVLLGCMIESSIGTTAASHLAPLADWVDLDGHLWVQNDDYTGIQFDSRGMLLPPTFPGIGAQKREFANQTTRP
jgi:L-alanine-DL-glutamate epimerase-like enolase superfamily enzyme